MSKDNLRDKLRLRFANVRRPTEIIPVSRKEPSGIYQHFATDAERKEYLQYIEDNKDVLPF